MKWTNNISSAQALQNKLRERIRIDPLRKRPSYIAGVDAAFIGNKVVAVACLFSYPGIEPLEDADAIEASSFPYVPGFLAFREGPALITALKRLTRRPNLLLVDGHGIAHPRGLGIASHLGILLDIPTIGCAKSRLVGEYAQVDQNKGSWSQLTYNGEAVGAVLRTRSHVKPVFVSVGHKIDIAGSIKIVLNCSIKFRIPEPLRRADMLSKQLKSEAKSSSTGSG